MAAVESMGAVNSTQSAAQIQAEYQGRVLAKQQEVVRDLGNAALKLIDAVLTQDAGTGRRLDLSV